MKADRLSDALFKTNVVGLSQLEEARLRLQPHKTPNGKTYDFAHIDLKKPRGRQIRHTYSFLTFEDYAKEFDSSLLDKLHHTEAVHHQTIPGSLQDGVLTILTAIPDNQETLNFFQQRFSAKEVQQIIITEKEIFHIIRQHYKDPVLNETLYSLLQKHHDLSAFYVFSKQQVMCIGTLLLAILIGIYFSPRTTFIIFFFLVQFLYLISIAFRMLLVIGGVKTELTENISPEEVRALKDEDLPIYTILIPVYDEPQVISILIKSLKNLDYPEDKLDVLLLFEEKDFVTLEAAKKADPPRNWRFIIVPASIPQTKPKACDYGLQFARGEYLTIYDGEDIPDPDQLKKALIGHRKLGNKCLCVQAALNYFNSHENYITGLFTLEYSYWFDYLLPGLAHFDFAIPLGGTSNHFNTKHLREVGGWDPFNTTEDADLGIRAFFHGFSIGVISSTTLEEANSRYWNWIRQRSRWIKGYMQTSLVYNRHPWKLMKKIGLKKWIGFQLLITGTPLIFLLNPIVWGMFLVGLFAPQALSGLHLPEALTYIGFINLVIGNFLGIYFNMLGVFKRRFFTLLPLALLNPLYWLFFHSVAAYKALWQLFSNPFYWEKTQHGLSHFKTQQ